MSSLVELNYALWFTKPVLRRQSLESNVRFSLLTYKLFGLSRAGQVGLEPTTFPLTAECSAD